MSHSENVFNLLIEVINDNLYTQIIHKAAEQPEVAHCVAVAEWAKNEATSRRRPVKCHAMLSITIHKR